MKLRNKKTGEVINVDFIYPETAEYFCRGYKLRDFIRDWEDYELQEPLIKDEKIRKAIRAWADIEGYKEMSIYVGTRWNKFQCDVDSDEVVMDSEIYTIAELCGEEEG